MKRILLVASCWSFFFCSCFCLPVKYGFFQELVNRPRFSPHVVGPSLNLQKLDRFVRDKYRLNKITFRERKEWVTQESRHRLAWYRMWGKLNESTGIRYKALLNYLEAASASAPVIPYAYNKKGRSVGMPYESRFLSKPSFIEKWDIPKGKVDAVPFAFLDHAVTEMHMKVKPDPALSYRGALLRLGLDFHGVTIPLFRDDDGVYRIYYREEDEDDGWIIKREEVDKNIQEALDANAPKPGEWSSIADMLKGSNPALFERLVKRLQKLCFLSEDEAKLAVLWRPKIKLRKNIIRTLDFTMVGGVPYKGGYEKKGTTYVPCQYGLCKLMFLCLGINNENNTMSTDDDQYDAYSDLVDLVEDTGVSHPWNKDLFSKDKFLNYEIAEVLKRDKDLLRRVEQTIDFSIKPLQQFKKLMNGGYYRTVNNKLRPIIKQEVDMFLPGYEQALAMMLIEAVHFLWLQACWFKPVTAAFLKWYVVQFGTKAWRLGWLMHLKDFVNNAHKLQKVYPKRVGAWWWLSYKHWVPEKLSFVDVWGQVVHRLLARWISQKNTRMNWMAFDGKAGFVMSFDPKLLEMQKASPVVDKKLLDALRFAGVDHHYANPLFTRKVVRYYEKLPFVE